MSSIALSQSSMHLSRLSIVMYTRAPIGGKLLGMFCKYCWYNRPGHWGQLRWPWCKSLELRRNSYSGRPYFQVPKISGLETYL